MATGILETCQEGERWNPCGGSREVFVYEGTRYASCDLCGLVTEVAGEDFDDSDDIFNAPSPGAIGETVAETMQRERFSSHRCWDDSDIQPYTRTTRY